MKRRIGMPKAWSCNVAIVNGSGTIGPTSWEWLPDLSGVPDLELSHGLCPHCLDTYYGDLLAKRTSERRSTGRDLALAMVRAKKCGIGVQEPDLVGSAPAVHAIEE